MVGRDSPETRAFIEKVTRELASVEHRNEGSFISTPLLYPSGATVVVRVEPVGQMFFVSDVGLGYQEADMAGASLSYARHGRLIAEEAGVGFDNQCFFMAQASRDHLAGVVVAIANCSLEAVSVAIHKLSERKTAAEADLLYERLARVFTAPRVTKNAEIRGASNTNWDVASLVRVNDKQTVFEPVLNHKNSVAAVATKFHDIALLDHAPARVAVVYRKEDFGTLLGVLSQAGSVVTRNVSDDRLRQLARAA